MKSNNYYNPNLREYALDLRNESVSKAEKILWKALLRRSQMGVKFKRQRPIDNFIVDFFSQEIGLIIEVDGNSHNHKGEYDRYRQDRLESFGYTVVRFEEGEVIWNLSDVHYRLTYIIRALRNSGF